jgi:hypothetical protein
MYQVDNEDRVVKLENVPQSSVGAPIPVVVGDERKVVVAFFVQDIPDGWNGTSVRVVSDESEEPVAVVEFKSCYAYMSGPPNDEAFDGHPLADRGLHPYGAFEVLNSSWIRQLERMNSVHEYHKPDSFWELHHYIFAFHDSTFECISAGFQITEAFGSMRSVVPLMAEKLWAR